MKGKFNIPMTEYYVEGEGLQELEYAEAVCGPWLEKRKFIFKDYVINPMGRGRDMTFTFKVTYITPPEFQVDAFYRNLTNYKF